MKKLLLLFPLLCSLAFGAANDVNIQQINSAGTMFVNRTVAPAASGLFYFNSSKVPASAAYGTGVLAALQAAMNGTGGLVGWGGDIGAATGTSLVLTGSLTTGSGGVELGNASDTSLTRASAGQLAVEGNAVFTAAKTLADALQTPQLVTLTSSSTDTYAGTAGVTATAYTTGTHYTFAANTANTGAASLNINGLGAKTIVKVAGGVTTTLADNDIRSGQIADVVYDGTNFQLQSLLGNAGGGTPGGSNLDLQYNNNGAFGGYTPATGIAMFLTTAAIPSGATATTQSIGDSSTKPGTTAFVTTSEQPTANAQTGTTYTLVLADSYPGSNFVTMSNAAANTLTVPTNASVAIATGAQILVQQLGAGPTTIAAAGGVTINSAAGNLTIGAQYGFISLQKTGTNTWNLIGTTSIWSNGVVGTNTNDSATAGNLGEYVSSLVAIGSPQSLSNGTAANVTSISLTAGDWDVTALASVTETTSTVTARIAGISTTSATLPTDGSEGYNGVQSVVTSETNSIPLNRKRISVASTTTVYLVEKVTFSAGTAGGFGSLNARRVR